MIISSGYDFSYDISKFINITEDTIFTEIKIAFVQGNNNVIKTMTNEEVSIWKSLVSVHLTQEDTSKFKYGPHAYVEWQIFCTIQGLDDPIGTPVFKLPIFKSLKEAIIEKEEED